MSIRCDHLAGMKAIAAGTSSSMIVPISTFFGLFHHRKQSMATMPTSAPREYEPSAASAHKAIAASRPRLTICWFATWNRKYIIGMIVMKASATSLLPSI